MDKEKFITIGIGLLVGICAAIIYFLAVRYLPAKFQGEKKTTFTPSTSLQSPVSSNQFTIDKPDDRIATTSSQVTFSGTANPGSRLVFLANNDEKIASVGALGKFSVDIKLEDGENEISVTAIDENKNMVVIKRNITLEITP